MTRSVPRARWRAPEGAAFDVLGPACTLNPAAGRTSAELVVATVPATTAPHGPLAVASVQGAVRWLVSLADARLGRSEHISRKRGTMAIG